MQAATFLCRVSDGCLPGESVCPDLSWSAEAALSGPRMRWRFKNSWICDCFLARVSALSHMCRLRIDPGKRSFNLKDLGLDLKMLCAKAAVQGQEPSTCISSSSSLPSAPAYVQTRRPLTGVCCRAETLWSVFSSAWSSSRDHPHSWSDAAEASVTASGSSNNCCWR